MSQVCFSVNTCPGAARAEEKVFGLSLHTVDILVAGLVWAQELPLEGRHTLVHSSSKSYVAPFLWFGQLHDATC